MSRDFQKFLSCIDLESDCFLQGNVLKRARKKCVNIGNFWLPFLNYFYDFLNTFTIINALALFPPPVTLYLLGGIVLFTLVSEIKDYS